MDDCKECKNTIVWNTLDSELRPACLGLREAVSTNYFVFVRTDLERRIMFIFHLDDVIKETFWTRGPKG